MREARSLPLAHRSARVIGTDALLISLILQEPSDGQEHKQDTKDDPNINARIRAALLPRLYPPTRRERKKSPGRAGALGSTEVNVQLPSRPSRQVRFVPHVWMAPSWQGFSSRSQAGRRSHVFGLLVRFT